MFGDASPSTGEYHIYRSPAAITNNILLTAVYPPSICASPNPPPPHGVVTRARFYYLIPLDRRLALFSERRQRRTGPLLFRGNIIKTTNKSVASKQTEYLHSGAARAAGFRLVPSR